VALDYAMLAGYFLGAGFVLRQLQGGLASISFTAVFLAQHLHYLF